MILSLPKTKVVVYLFVVAAITATLVIAGLYFVSLYPVFKFSGLNQDWGYFGDYIGGTLGTFFSLLAFFGVLFTIWLQTIQLKLAKEQAQLDEIQRVLATISTRLDQLLSIQLNYQFNNFNFPLKPADFFTVLSAGGTAILSQPHPDWITQATNAEIITKCKSALKPHAPLVGIELNQLAWLLIQYKKHNGATAVVEFYTRRYSAVFIWLYSLELISEHPYINEIFDTELLRKALTPTD